MAVPLLMYGELIPLADAEQVMVGGGKELYIFAA
jgi:hypothetical protein